MDVRAGTRINGKDELYVFISNLYDNVAVLHHHKHSRMRVYPQDVRVTASLVAGAANTFGSWIQIIPITTIDFCYEVVGIVIESADAATTYHIQLGFSTTDTDPLTPQILGERRTLLPTPVTKATELLEFYSMECPANAKLWGRVKSAAGGSETIEVSVGVIRHIAITNPIDHLTTWPWST